MIKSLSHIFWVILLLSSVHSRAQDIHFSQWSMAPLVQNPASAGALNNFEAYLNYRNQWRSITTPFKTYAASAMGKINKGKSKKGYWGAGALFYSDQAGDGSLKTTGGNLVLSRHVKLSKYENLGFGINGGFGQRSINFEQFQWGSQYNGASYDPSAPVGESFQGNSFGYLDLSSGIVYSFNNTSGLVNVTSNNFKQGSFGISASHLNRPNYSFLESGDRLRIRWTAHGEVLWSIKHTPLAIQPGFQIYQQGPSNEILVGSLIRLELLPDSKYTGFYKGGGIFGGVYYRTNDALIFSGMIQLGQYSFGFSYDMNTSKLVAASGGRGAIEFSFRIINQNPYFKQSRVI